MRRSLSVIIILSLILASCKKKTTEPQTQNNLNQQTAQGIAPAVAGGIAGMASSMFNPESSIPMVLKKFGIKQNPCVTKSGDTTDADNDGYFRDATLNFNCNYQDQTSSWSLTGEAYVKDKDDNDRTSGFYMKITDLKFQMTTQGQSFSWIINATYDIDKTQNGWGGHVDYSFTYSNSTSTTFAFSLDFNYAPDNPSDPWGAGTINFNGNFSVKYNNVNYSFQIIVQDLYYDENSGCEYPHHGTVEIKDGTNSLKIIYSCNSYTAYYNGQQIPAAY